MKCINRKRRQGLAQLLLCSVMLCGCGQQSIDMQYDSDYPVSSYRIVNAESTPVADSFASDLCVAATDVSENTEVDMSQATAAGLFNLNTGEVIFAKNIHTRLQPASLTKVMTALVALKYSNPDDIITATSNVSSINESGAQLYGFQEGDQVTMDQALHALLMYSANDAGILIAEHISGSVEAFSERMNQEAASIGATNSNFVNPHGLSDDNHYVTAYDMYLIFNEAMKYDLFTEIINMDTYDTVYTDKAGNPVEMSLETTNQYLKGVYKAPEQVTVIGGKTGTTNAAGNCLIILSRDISGNPYISVVLCSKERAILYEEMSDMLNEINN